MTVNTINYTVEANGVTPAVIKSGGVQGDHNVTKLVFSLPQSFVDVLFSNIPDGEKLYYRFDGYSGANVMRSTEAIELTKSDANGVELSYFLENWITKDGGNVVVNLVLVHINTDVDTESELYCFPVSLALKSRSGRAAYNEAYKGVTSAELAAKEAARRAGIYEQGAISAMDQSSEYARKSEEQALAAKESANSAAEKLEEFKNFEKLSIDQTYNPESENAQSGKAVAEAISDIPISQAIKIYKLTPCLPSGLYVITGSAIEVETELKHIEYGEIKPFYSTILCEAPNSSDNTSVWYIWVNREPIFKAGGGEISDEEYYYKKFNSHIAILGNGNYITSDLSDLSFVEFTFKYDGTKETPTLTIGDRIYRNRTIKTSDELELIGGNKLLFLASYQNAGIYDAIDGMTLMPLEIATPDGEGMYPYCATNKLYVDTVVGSIETALDSIIAIQNQLIGGGN